MIAKALVAMILMTAAGYLYGERLTEGDIIVCGDAGWKRLPVGHDGEILIADYVKGEWRWVPVEECDGTDGTPNLKEHGWQPFPDVYYQGIDCSSGGDLMVDQDGKTVRLTHWWTPAALKREGKWHE